MPVDMHVHTSASDGTDSPVEVVARAKEIGLEAIAITDHDTVEGIKPAMEAGHVFGIEVIPGIELSTESNEEEIHILGYLLDITDKEFLKTISLFRSYRLKRVEQMVGKLQKLGLPVVMDRVMAFSGTGSVGRPHLAAAMVEAGVVNDLAEAFDKFIGKGCPAYVPRYKIEPAEAVQLIRKANGLPVLAHPGLSYSSKSILELVQKGLIGIEAYHPSHSRELSEYYRKLGEEYNLIITGGSDYHGVGHKEGQGLGMVTVSYAVLQEMKNRKGT
ncbi:MAG: DNA polymerase III PolC [Pelotomaculum sp. PtaB.Bin013]|uniref:PHP domain-containing protein n=1 Tax=Pelotomaculum isophthalicicum JI TaxID=947010 RepID=A0A9X4H2N7_9FIRM|nr:PHP domain-containing protein [Pelotomaculum isophthalicicum]MDF9407428.1 PHP domain-containing protein [Pelotomaculum isophthalicicum JI]OPX88104.1 MAG: DNA polymerase III PolC [Pelotomaculum sp. PtaB.Bin013]